MNLNSNPTEGELTTLIKNCDDGAANHVLWVDAGGEVHISPVPEELTPLGFEAATPSMKMRFETMGQGNGYVGEGAARDQSWTGSVFRALVREWPNAKNGPDVHYVDVF